MGGKNIISSQHTNHKQAVKKVTSVIAEDMKPPHAHITKVINGKTDFGRDKKHRKRTRSNRPYTAKTILTRKMRNIDPVLHQKEEFSEVREAFRRVRGVSSGYEYRHEGISVDNLKPVTFKLSKKLTENRHPNQFALNEHVKNLASLQRRLSTVNNINMRKKNS